MQHLLQGAVDVGGQVEVLVAVAVGVEEDGAGRPAVDAGAGGERLEGAVAAVAVEPVGPEVRHQQVGQAVAVGVADRDAGAPAVVAHAGALGDVVEAAVTAVAVEAVDAALGDLGAVEAPAVDQVEVEVAVAVVVEQRQAGAAGLEDVGLLLAAAPARRRQPRLGGAVDEAQAGRGRWRPGRGRSQDQTGGGQERSRPPHSAPRSAAALASNGSAVAANSCQAW